MRNKYLKSPENSFIKEINAYLNRHQNRSESITEQTRRTVTLPKVEGIICFVIYVHSLGIN